MELVILSMVIIFILLFFLYNKEINYIKKNEREEEKEDNICAPTDFNPANGAPMIGCLDIYGNPYGVSGAEDNHNDLSHNNTSADNSYNSSYDDTSYNSSYNNDSSNNSFYDDYYYKTSYDNDNNSY